MRIDNLTYILTPSNFVPIETEKKLIVIGHTFNHDMKHYVGWCHRYNGEYKKTAAFTITKEGDVYRHFSPRYYARFLTSNDLNVKSIVILLENDGWLIKNGERNEFLTWLGDIYKQPSEVVEKRWRGYIHWASYTSEQLESLAILVKTLCERYKIPLNVIGHNTKVDRLFDYTGVLYKSNIEKHYTDLSPSWDCELFKNKLEEKVTI